MAPSFSIVDIDQTLDDPLATIQPRKELRDLCSKKLQIYVYRKRLERHCTSRIPTDLSMAETWQASLPLWTYVLFLDCLKFPLGLSHPRGVPVILLRKHIP